MAGVTWPRQQYRANCGNGTDTAFHRTYSCYNKRLHYNFCAC